MIASQLDGPGTDSSLGLATSRRQCSPHSVITMSAPAEPTSSTSSQSLLERRVTPIRRLSAAALDPRKRGLSCRPDDASALARATLAARAATAVQWGQGSAPRGVVPHNGVLSCACTCRWNGRVWDNLWDWFVLPRYAAAAPIRTRLVAERRCQREKLCQQTSLGRRSTEESGRFFRHSRKAMEKRFTRQIKRPDQHLSSRAADTRG